MNISEYKITGVKDILKELKQWLIRRANEKNLCITRTF
jgi:hypothetical protein